MAQPHLAGANRLPAAGAGSEQIAPVAEARERPRGGPVQRPAPASLIDAARAEPQLHGVDPTRLHQRELLFEDSSRVQRGQRGPCKAHPGHGLDLIRQQAGRSGHTLSSRVTQSEHRRPPPSRRNPCRPLAHTEKATSSSHAHAIELTLRSNVVQPAQQCLARERQRHNRQPPHSPCDRSIYLKHTAPYDAPDPQGLGRTAGGRRKAGG